MEVDALTRKGGKGKDDKGGKGKGKGKGKDSGKEKGGKTKGGTGTYKKGKGPAEGCFICGENHWARDCSLKGKGCGSGKGHHGQ